MTGVRFIEHYGIWNSGELAGFAPERAAELVAAGVAVYDERQFPPVEDAPKKGRK